MSPIEEKAADRLESIFQMVDEIAEGVSPTETPRPGPEGIPACKGSRCPEPHLCGPEQECLWDQWNWPRVASPAKLRNIADWLISGRDVGQAAIELRMLALDLERQGDPRAPLASKDEVMEGIRQRHALVEESIDKIATAAAMAYLSHLDRGDLLNEVQRLTQETPTPRTTLEGQELGMFQVPRTALFAWDAPCDPRDFFLVRVIRPVYQQAACDPTPPETSAWRPMEGYLPSVEPPTFVLIAEQKPDGSYAVGEAQWFGDDGWRWAGNSPTDHWGREVYPAYYMPLPDPPPSLKTSCFESSGKIPKEPQ